MNLRFIIIFQCCGNMHLLTTPFITILFTPELRITHIVVYQMDWYNIREINKVQKNLNKHSCDALFFQFRDDLLFILHLSLHL